MSGKSETATVHRCGSCEKIYGDPHIDGDAEEKEYVCPFCATPTANSSTEVSEVVF